MRVAIMLLMILALTACEDRTSCPREPDVEPWTLRDDRMNLAILLVDYETYALQGGNVSHYELCDGCDPQGLPFEPVFDPPADFGSITFVYTETGDTLFDATIIWRGMGRIRYPESFLEPDKFNVKETAKELPSDLEYYAVSGTPTTPDEDTLERTGRAWETVSFLDVVHAYAERPYRVGFYLYPPTVGAFDPSVAQWVVFLYRGKVLTKAAPSNCRVNLTDRPRHGACEATAAPACVCRLCIRQTDR